MSGNGKFPAVFLDRDGVIVHNRANYICSWDELRIYASALPALARLSRSKYKIIIITNQSAIGRNLVSIETIAAINARLVEMIRTSGGRIDAVYMCPHAPSERCSCRKPQPGLILQAADDLNIDLAQSILIGDAVSDIQAAISAGVGQSILLQTGRGKKQIRLISEDLAGKYRVEPSLITAIRKLFP